MEHIAYALVGLEIVGLVAVRTAGRGLHVTSQTDRSRLTAGEEIEETYHFEKHSRWPASWVEIAYGGPGFGIEYDHVGLPGGGSTLLTRRRVLPHRGRFEVAGGTVRVRDPLGLFSLRRTTLETIPITVHPQPIEVPEAIDAVLALTSSQHRWRRDGADATLGDLRQYNPGDPPSRIHWRSSARVGRLMVTDPEAQRRRAIWLLVDLGGDTAETAAGIAAYLAERLWHSGRDVGALIAGESIALVPARRGREQPGHILEALAGVPDGEVWQAERLLGSVTRCEDPGAFVFISPALERESRTAERSPADPCRTLRAIFPSAGVIPIVPHDARSEWP